MFLEIGRPYRLGTLIESGHVRQGWQVGLKKAKKVNVLYVCPQEEARF